MDIWAGMSPENAKKLVTALPEFGFSQFSVDAAAFLDEKRIIRMGAPPVCIDLIMSISGLDFATCYARRVVGEFDGTTVNLLRLEDLKTDKRASGRHKDLDDLENLP